MLALILARVTAPSVLAWTQGQLVDGLQNTLLLRVFLAGTIGAAFLVVAQIGGLYEYSLTRELSELTELELTTDLLHWSTEAATVEHLEEPEYLDRQSRVLRDAGAVAYAAWAAISAIGTVVALMVTLALLFRVDILLPLVVVFTVPAVLLAGRAGILHLNIVDSTEHLLRWEEDLHQLATKPESLAEIKGSDQGNAVDRAASQIWIEAARKELRVRAVTVALTASGWAFYTLGIGLSTWWVIELAHRQALSIGDIAVTMALTVGLLGQVSAVLRARNSVIESGRVTEHYLWLKERTEELPRARNPIGQLRHGISLDHVSFRYPGGRKDVLTDINLHIPAGSVLGIVGVNGAGKSTLVMLLTGLYTPTGGQLLADGAPVEPGQLSQSTSATFQDYLRPQTLAHEAIGIGHLPEIDNIPAVARAAEEGSADSFIERLPKQWTTQLGSTFDGHRPSQGQWQRVALSRGMMRPDPVILVLDEPTATLDPQAEHDLFRRFAERARSIAARTGAVTILVSHRFSTVTMTDQIVVIDDGRIAEAGTHDELMARQTQYRSLFMQQARGYESDGATA
ncbi:ATP-binding cassette domain-containing protein [Microlunatus elymi]|uniref:ATP-binding cassette domain-containing protein n=1 Tax=Microlunatus elymi TaxID=2596828 RepID=UPI00143D9A6A|nr:ABC transporter ATP-binding protein [Microlunatus elymi]